MADIEGPEMSDSCLGLIVMEKSERLPITGAADCYSEQKISAKFAGVSTGHLGSNNRNWNVHSRRIIKCACILTMAVIAAVLGVNQLVLLSGPSKTRNYDHEHLRTVQVTGADKMQVVSRASASTYRLPQLFQVGGAGAVWTTPSTTSFFTSWAASISFRSGDVLRFAGGAPGTYVYGESAASYAACTTSSYLTWWGFSAGVDVYIQLIPVGTLYFTSDDAVACIGGLKVAPLVNSITVPPEPARPNVNVAQRAPQIFQVGGGTAGTWTVPTTTTFYTDWASNISFIIGDIIDFTFTDSSFEVNQVPYSSYEACTTAGYIWTAIASAKFQFTTAGVAYFVAYTPQYCVQGMRFAVNIYDPSTTNASPPATPNASPPATPTPVVSPTSAPPVPPMSAPTNPPSPSTPTSTTPPKPATPPPSPTTNSSSPSSPSKVGAIVGGVAGGGIAGITAILVLVKAVLDIWKKQKPTGGKDFFNCCNFHCIKVKGKVDKIESINVRDITPENATDNPMIGVETKK